MVLENGKGAGLLEAAGLASFLGNAKSSHKARPLLSGGKVLLNPITDKKECEQFRS